MTSKSPSTIHATSTGALSRTFACLALLASCSDPKTGAETEAETEAGDTSSDATGEETGGELPETFDMVGTVTSNQAPGVTPPPLAGATVCILGADLCATTGADGGFAIDEVPNGLDTRLEIVAEGHIRQFFPFYTAHESLNVSISAWPRGGLALLVAAIGETIDNTKGHIGGSFQDETGEELVGYTLVLEPADGVGPLYATEDGIEVGTGPATSGAWGWGNISAGEYSLTFSHPDFDCPPNLLEQGVAEANTATYMIEVDTMTTGWTRRCVPKG